MANLCLIYIVNISARSLSPSVEGEATLFSVAGEVAERNEHNLFYYKCLYTPKFFTESKA